MNHNESGRDTLRIATIGAGYVGLVCGACFSQLGVDVVCIDSNRQKIEMLKSGQIPIYEPGLAEMIHENVKARRLSFTTDLNEGVQDRDVVFIAVGTPTLVDNGRADLRQVATVAEQLATSISPYTVVVNKSTVPVGTAQWVEQLIKQAGYSYPFDVVSNPEFLREGSAIHDFLNPDRVVIGCASERAQQVMEKLYQPLTQRNIPILFTGRESAEIIKYAANSFLATKIAFINEVSDLCEKTGANIQDVAYGIGLDRRIGSQFLQPGPGYGGSCFPKDTLALMHTARDFGTPLRTIETVVEANSQRKRGMAARIAQACNGDITGKQVAILGVTFKANTDDVRESPSLDIVPALQAQGAHVRIYDPQGRREAEKLFANVTWCESIESCLTGADVAAILTEWTEFKNIQLSHFCMLMNKAVVVDLRNLYVPEQMQAAGIEYYSLGRPSSMVMKLASEDVRASPSSTDFEKQMTRQLLKN